MLDWSLGTRLDRYGEVSVYAATNGEARGLAWVGRSDEFRDRSMRLAAAEVPGLVRTHTHVEAGRIVRLDTRPDGATLDQVLADRGFTERELLRIGQRLAHTLASLHGLGIAHGAVSLRNITLSGGPRTWTPELGSPAPERTLGLKRAIPVPGAGPNLAPSEDVYALGVVLASLVYGRQQSMAEPGGDPTEPGPVVRVGHMLADDLAGLVLERAVERVPERRPSARWIADRLHAVLTAPPIRRSVH